MGLGGISIWQLLIILVIVLLLFGTKRLRNIGADLGNAIKGFRGAMRDGDKEGGSNGQGAAKLEKPDSDEVIEGEVTARKKEQS